jgi:prophage tail gpP-like protein
MPLGFTESDFVLSPYLSRDLITGLDSRGRGAPGRTDLEPIKVDQAKVQNSESIYDAADRHLRRHSLIHWDSPDGKIVVGSPNDTQEPSYFFRYRRTGDTHLNNVLSATRGQDLSGIPSTVVVHGRGGKPGRTKQPITGFAKDDDVYRNFHRPVIIVADGIRQQALAEAAARRELSARSKNKDIFSIETDGLSFWNGYRNVDFAIDTVCSIDSDVVGLSGEPYFIPRVTLRRDANGGDTTSITALKKGVWIL